MGALNFRSICKAIRGDDRFEMREAKGSHVVVRGPDSTSITIYHEHGGRDGYPPGTRSTIKKWFLRFGVVLSLVAASFAVYPEESMQIAKFIISVLQAL